MVTVTIELWTVWKHVKEGKCNCVGEVGGWLEEEGGRDGGERRQYCHQARGLQTRQFLIVMVTVTIKLWRSIIEQFDNNTGPLQTHAHFRASPSLHYYTYVCIA